MWLPTEGWGPHPSAGDEELHAATSDTGPPAKRRRGGGGAWRAFVSESLKDGERSFAAIAAAYRGLGDRDLAAYAAE